MKKKVLWTIVFFLFLWGLFFGAILFIQWHSRVLENLLQENITEVFAGKAEIHLGKIKGNIFGNFTIDSSFIAPDSFHTFSFRRAKISYSIWSLIFGKYRLSSINISGFTFHGRSKLNSTGVTEKTPETFDFDEKTIRFERILPDTFHVVLKEIIRGIPDIQIRKIELKEINGKWNDAPVLENGYVLASINGRKFQLLKFRGKVFSRYMIDGAKFVLDWKEESARFNQIEIVSGKSKILAKADLDLSDRFRLILALDQIRIASDLAKIALQDSTPSGLNLQGYIYAYPESLYFDMKGNGFIKNIQIRTGIVKGTIGKKNLYIRDLHILSDKGSIDGRLYSLFGSRSYVRMRGKNLDLSFVRNKIDSSNINISLEATLDNWDFQRMNGWFLSKIEDSKINRIHIYKAQLKILARNGVFTIDPQSGLYLTEKDKFLVSGSFKADWSGNILLEFQDVDFSALGNAFRIPGLVGNGSGKFQLKGNLQDPNAESSILLDSLGIGANILYGIEMQLTMNNLLSKRVGHTYLEVSSGIAGGIYLTDATIKLTSTGRKVFIDSLTFYNFQNFLDIRGSADYQTEPVRLNFDRFLISYRDIRLFNDDTLMLDIYPSDSRIEFQSFHLVTNRKGEIDARGILSWANSSMFALYLNQIDINFINQFRIFDFNASGFCNLEFTLFDTITAPDIQIDGKFTALKLDTLSLGEIGVNGFFRNQMLSLDSLYWISSTDTLFLKSQIHWKELNWKKMAFGQEDFLDVRINRFDLAKLRHLFQLKVPIEGIVEGEMNVWNEKAFPEGKGFISMVGFRYAEYRVDTLQFWMNLSRDNVKFQQGKISLDGTDFKFSGTIEIPQVSDIAWNTRNFPLLFYLSTETDKLSFLGDMNEEVQGIYGWVKLDAEIKGYWDDVIISYGRIEAEDATVYLYKIANPIKVTQFEGTVKNNVLYIENLQGETENIERREGLLNKLFSWLNPFGRKKMEKGVFAVDGTVQLDSHFNPRYDIKVTGNNVRIDYFIEDIRLVASTNNLVVKGKDTIIVEGDVTVHSGRYLFDLGKYERSLLLVLSEVETPPYLQLNLNIDIPGNFYFKQEGQFNKVNFELLGRLRLLKEPMGLYEPYGLLEIVSGDVFFYGKKIKISSGKIQFDNPKELPKVEFLAEYKSPPYYFEIAQKGSIGSPEIDIKVYDLTSNSEIEGLELKDKLSILVTGMTLQDLTRQGDQALKEQGIDLAAKSFLSFVEGQTEQLIGFDRVSLETPNRLNAGISDMSLLLGKYLTNNIYVEYRSPLSSTPFAQKLSWDPGNELNFLYRISRNWSLGTTFLKTEEGNNKVSFNISWKMYF